jgi:hypothetical protein
VIGDCTLATAGLLLVSAMLVALAATVATVTVPCVTPPTPIVDALRVTLEIPGPMVVGELGELDCPHPTAERATRTMKKSEELLSSFIMHG